MRLVAAVADWQSSYFSYAIPEVFQLSFTVSAGHHDDSRYFIGMLEQVYLWRSGSSPYPAKQEKEALDERWVGKILVM